MTIPFDKLSWSNCFLLKSFWLNFWLILNLKPKSHVTIQTKKVNLRRRCLYNTFFCGNVDSKILYTLLLIQPIARKTSWFSPQDRTAAPAAARSANRSRLFWTLTLQCWEERKNTMLGNTWAWWKNVVVVNYHCHKKNIIKVYRLWLRTGM